MKNTDLYRQQNTRPDKGYTDALIGSATYAARARDALADAAIRVQIIKQSSRALGCVYGIRFSAAQRANVAYVLQRADIVVREYVESTP